MKQQWARYAAKLDAMSVRERTMVFVAGAVVIAFIFWLLALQSASDRNRRLSTQAAADHGAAATLAAQVKELQRTAASDPDAPAKAHLADIDRQLAELEAGLEQRQGGFIPPSRMPELVQGLLAHTPGLQLVSMRTLPVAPLAEALPQPGAAPPTPQAAAGLYKHGLDLTVEGRFADLVSYATQLEKMPVHVLWNRTRIDALAYPKVTMTLTLYTLSLERAWLQL